MLAYSVSLTCPSLKKRVEDVDSEELALDRRGFLRGSIKSGGGGACPVSGAGEALVDVGDDGGDPW